MVRSWHSIAKVSTVDTNVIVIGLVIFQMISSLKNCGLNLAVEIPNSIPFANFTRNLQLTMAVEIPNSIPFANFGQNLELTKLKL